TVPGHERDEHVAAERELTVLRARTVGDDLSLFDMLAFVDEDLLVDAGRSVGTHELADRIDEYALLRIVLNLLLGLRQLAVFGDDDLVAADGSDFAAFIGNHHRA